MPRCIAFAALMGWPSCIVADCPAVLVVLSGYMLCYAALSEVLCRFWVPAAMLVWAALSDGYGGYACCVAYSLEFSFGAAMMLAPLAVENTRLFVLLEMVQVVFCVENWVLGSSSQRDDADPFEWVEVESYEPEPPCTMVDNTPTFLTLWVRRAGGVGASMSSCTTFSSMECRRGCTAWRRT